MKKGSDHTAQPRLRIFRQYVICAGLLAFGLGASSCKDKAARDESSTAPAPVANQAATWHYVGVDKDSKRRIYLTDVSGNDRLLIRVALAGEPKAGMGPNEDLAQKEFESTRLWLACKTRVTSGSFPNALTEHDAWLETAERLEQRLKQDPDHLGVLRDLIVAYVHLLYFESNTSLGGNLCLLGGRRISEFERKAAPLEPADQELINRARTAIFYAMKLYPCVLECVGKTEEREPAKSWHQALAIFGQDSYLDPETFAVGKLTVRTYRNSGKPPDPRLLWEDLFFVIAGHDPMTPESTAAYVLVQQGPQGREHYYLYFRAANRSQLVLIYGAGKPDYGKLRSWVEDSVREDVSRANGY